MKKLNFLRTVFNQISFAEKNCLFKYFRNGHFLEPLLIKQNIYSVLKEFLSLNFTHNFIILDITSFLFVPRQISNIWINANIIKLTFYTGKAGFHIYFADFQKKIIRELELNKFIIVVCLRFKKLEFKYLKNKKLQIPAKP